MLIKNKKAFTFFDHRNVDLDLNKQILFICDHSSNFIPTKYKKLGLKKEVIYSHIAWDIGAKELTLKLSKNMNACCFFSNFSRLLIDPNRKIDDDDLIIRDSFGQFIPGNEKLSKLERENRINFFYNKYHNNLERIIKEKFLSSKTLYLISIHSFNRKVGKYLRPNEVGLLWHKDKSIMIPLKKELEKLKISVGNNKPYSGFHYNYTLDRHSLKKSFKNICIEIRNDLICDEKGIKKWSNLLKLTLNKVLNEKNR